MMCRASILFVNALVLLGPGRAVAQRLPSGDAVLHRFEETFADVRDFTVTVSAAIDMERIRVPKMEATVYFKKPDKFHVVSSGFMMLPREGMALDPALLRARYRADVQALDTVDGRAAYRLELTAKSPAGGMNEFRLWIDRVTWTPLRMDANPYEGRSLSMRFEYALVEGRIWLPVVIRANFDVRDTRADRPGVPDATGQEYQEPPRAAPRAGSMTIRYSEYRLNTGLSDDIFKKAEESPPKQKP